MIPFKALRSLATKVGDILSRESSLPADDSQRAAEQRKDCDITKSTEAQLSKELGNVVRVPSTDGTGVSQAPATDAIRKDAWVAGEQPPVALQGQPSTAVCASPASDAHSTRIHLMEAVRQARGALTNSKLVQASTAADYARKTKHLSKKIQSLAKTWPQQESNQAVRIMQVALGEYASKSNSFFAQRRALQYWTQLRLEQALKDQDQLQKAWPKASDEIDRNLLLEKMHKATKQLNSMCTQFLEAGAFERKACGDAFAVYLEQQGSSEDSSQEAQALNVKQLVAVLNRRVPDWRQQFLLVNEKSTGRYRSHALVQALGGIQPTEFDPHKNQPNGTASQNQVKPGVVVTLCDGNRVRVRVPGGKVGSHAGQVERCFELEQQALPQWFVQELQEAGGSKTFTAKPQALRDHYERVSKQVFKDMTYGKSKKPLHVTPYCFRHIVATDLRESGWAVEEIAAALGQRSADTQFQYGFRNGGKRKPQAGKQAGIVKGSVAATSPVTPPKSTWAQVSSKIQNGKAKNSPKL